MLDVERCADCCDGTVTRFSTCGARLRGYSCFRLPHFGSVLNYRYRSIQAQVSFFQHSSTAALYKKRPRGVQRGAALRPFAVFSHSNVILPSAGFRIPCGTYGRAFAIHAVIRPDLRSLCDYTAGIPQSMRHIRPDLRNLCGIYSRGLRSLCAYYFPIQNLENISLTRSSPSDSPRIRPRLSYASVRSME